ncbi:type IV pilus modification protein PilV [Wenzhouxiangella sediminis]|uniref:Type IV pilus modification protein PilV n=1 Tax=Wenzhouxiangella sediminis TaxID=1792836 RepID=A0A3E1K9Y8_9GAMM|nr:type IV pilus modification protein PilV [Wenzhouxiangella sediminis]RFF31099.1 type IV pilus modification protein PilV [Wenzhouxiangella sediminis]
MGHRRHQFPARQGGTSMIEVLVTILVMSVGLLGLAALQGFSLQAGQSAYYRTQATNLAYEVTDFARVNRSAAIDSCSLPVLESWDNFVETQLPGGELAIQFTNCDAGQITVTVTWDEARIEDAVSDGESLVMTTRI